MEKNQEDGMKLISYLCLIIAILLLIGGIIWTQKFKPEFQDNLPCYDRHGNLIKELNCEGYESSADYAASAISTGFIVVLFLFLFYLSHPMSRRVNI